MTADEESAVKWMWLSFACGAGSSAPEKLIGEIGGIEAVYNGTEEEYRDAGVTSEELVSRLCDKETGPAEEVYRYCKEEGIGILTCEDALYPERLKRIQARPAVLYYKGNIKDLDKELCIAEVGTRYMSEYGSSWAYSIAYDLAKAGAVVVSGMAKGIDGMAHRGAIDGGGYTVAVLGCGLDRAYPSEHTGMMQEIIKRGLVISEYRPFTVPLGKNFPIRNRIISGLSQGTLVVEAPENSGALITAHTAVRQGRDIYAIPGKIGEYNSRGTNQLIREGAKAVTCVEDVILEYFEFYAHKINLNNISSIRSRRKSKPINERVLKAAEPRAKAAEESIKLMEQLIESGKKEGIADCGTSKTSEDQEKVMKIIEEGGVMSADEVKEKSGMMMGQVLAALTMLEVTGRITAMPGGFFKKI